MRVNENILISSLTTMRLGGPARYVLEIERPEDIPDAYGFAATYQMPTFVLGYGANTIGHDEGFPGAIRINRMHGITSEPIGNDTRLRIMGGEIWDNVVAYACEKGLTGIEGLSKVLFAPLHMPNLVLATAKASSILPPMVVILLFQLILSYIPAKCLALFTVP